MQDTDTLKTILRWILMCHDNVVKLTIRIHQNNFRCNFELWSIYQHSLTQCHKRQGHWFKTNIRYIACYYLNAMTVISPALCWDWYVYHCVSGQGSQTSLQVSYTTAPGECVTNEREYIKLCFLIEYILFMTSPK